VKNKKTLVYIFIALIVLVLGYFFFGSSDALSLKGTPSVSPEISLSMTSPFAKLKSKVVAASCGFTPRLPFEGHSSEDSATCSLTINCCYGGNATGTGYSLCGGTCFGTTTSCQSHPSTGQACSMGTDACGLPITGTYDSCGLCIVSSPTRPSCSITNTCGQTFTGTQCPSGCTASNGTSDPNSSCIQNFNVTAGSINPNGSVEFSWNLAPSTTTRATCGFVDLTTPTARPIPGLQNLDTNTDRVRISNIQASTRFCLVCQFYSLINKPGVTVGQRLGEAASHQWVRVIRIGDN